MLILRIRQAEVAAGAGRLDEAFGLVTKDGRFRSHRRGQEAITRLVSALVTRGRQHLEADRITQAAADCEKARGLGGGDLPDVAQLAADLRAAHADRHRGVRDAAVAVATARRHVEDGALSIGRQVLTAVATGDSRAKRLMDDIDAQRDRHAAAVAAAQSAADRADWIAAAQSIARAVAIRPTGTGVLVELSQKVADALAKQAQSEFAAGRLDRAASTAESLLQVDSDAAIASDLTRALEHCRLAWDRLGQSRPHEAAEHLRRVEHLFPKTTWLTDAMKHVNAAEEALGQLRTGPLAFASSTGGQAFLPVSRGGTPPREPEPKVGRQENLAPIKSGSVLPERFILQVDGAGAFLIVRGAVTKIGPITSSMLPDVALVADAGTPVASIERIEDDYFLRSPSPVAVNDKSATNALLGSGDRITLSARCRLAFALPHPASTTAVLDLTGARYPRADVRRVVLFDRDLVLGNGPTAHVRVNGLQAPVVLNLRNGMLRTSVEATVNGKPLGREEGVPVGVPVVAGGASFVISRV